MAKLVVPLTDTRIKNAKPKKGKTVKLFDGGGLFLLVTPAGKKLWRFRYKRDGKETLMGGLGGYPAVTLADARKLRETLQKQVASGIDPVARRKAVKQGNGGNAAPGEITVELIANEWFNKFKPVWVSGYQATVRHRLDSDILPYIGARPVKAVIAKELLEKVLQKVENRNALDLAHRIHSICSRIFRYAVVTGRAERNPAIDLIGSIAPHKEKHFPAVVKPGEFAPLIQRIDNYQGSFIVQCGLKLAPRVFVRPVNLRYMEWAEIDLDAAQWTIPKNKMKHGEELIVPLARQVREVLADMRQLTGKHRFVLPSLRARHDVPISDGTLNVALVQLGIGRDVQTIHGFRATARTMLAEQLKYPAEWIELQLGHQVKDPLGRAYNRTQWLDERTEMMQRFADYLDELKHRAGVVPMRRKA